MAKAPQKTANSAANAPGADPAQGGGKQRSPVFYSVVIAVSAITCLLFYETVLLLAVGMLPSGVAYLIDTHPRRHATKTVAWMNLAGALIVAFELWESDTSLATTFDLLGDPVNWVIMLGGAGVGWVIHFTVPGIVLRYLDMSLDRQRKRLREQQEELEKEWGKEVRNNAPLERLAEVEAGPKKPDPEDEEPEEGAYGREDPDDDEDDDPPPRGAG